MAGNRQIKTPGAAPEPTTVDETKPTEQQAEATQADANQQPEDQVQTGDTESETESTVDQAALIEELRKQLEASENKNKALEGQLRRATPAKTTDMANAAPETPAKGSPYLSAKGWTRG
ncbi:hypothetical protein [Acinetobacter baumannii]|uniref:hypothetical protein n=1 Tax=Acinetobacter baumannii TaxID=470 RepID=UPI001F394445|nr:hypothetical protein [Acinetobacter baumannii]MDO7394661.1 hypothetical protein [Acinetobacter baumannii]UJX48821.1 hypothetical protein HUF98_03615 [Acinetobacter baumannii]